MFDSKGNPTEPSNFIWSKKKEKVNVDLDWSILNKEKPYFSACSPPKKMFVMSYKEISHHFLYKEFVEQMQ